MQPTQQNVVPVQLFSGNVATDGSTTVTLDPTYDHVITAISAYTESGADDQLNVFDSDSNFLVSLWVPVDPLLALIGAANLMTHIVCQSLSGLILYSLSGNLNASISADRLNPSATYLFS